MTSPNASPAILAPFLIAIAIAIAAVTTAGAAGGPPPGEQEQTIGDAWITSEITARLTHDRGVDAENIEVDTVAGVVYLSGFVTSAGEERTVIEIASSVRGVEAVESDLMVVSR